MNQVCGTRGSLADGGTNRPCGERCRSGLGGESPALPTSGEVIEMEGFHLGGLNQ